MVTISTVYKVYLELYKVAQKFSHIYGYYIHYIKFTWNCTKQPRNPLISVVAISTIYTETADKTTPYANPLRNLNKSKTDLVIFVKL